MQKIIYHKQHLPLKLIFLKTLVEAGFILIFFKKIKLIFLTISQII